MKKFFAMLVVAAMLASLCALTAFAEGEEEDWGPFGEVTAEYKEDLSQFITLDGDVSDWQSNGFQGHYIDKYNLDAWNNTTVPDDWSINMWFSADSEYLYIAFKINDKNVAYSSDGAYAGADAFQIQLDFNGWAAETGEFERAVFYSFGLQEDGTVDMVVQCIYGDKASDESYKMASDDEAEWRDGEVKGATKKAEDGSGWYAEFAISWQTLYNDISNKLLNDDLPVPEWTGGTDEVTLNMLVCYLDYTDGVMTGAFGTSFEKGSLSSDEGWFPESAGMILKLSGMGSVTVESTEAPTEEPTEAPTNAETDAPKETEAKTEAKTDAPEQTTEPAAEKSCGGVIGAGAIVAVLALGVCVVAKKKD